MQDKKVILIIDDNKDNIRIVRHRLKAIDHVNIHSVESGVNILSIVKTLNPDLIILDLLLPNISGFQIAKILKSNSSTKKIPIIMISAIFDEADVHASLKLGVERFYPKSEIFKNFSKLNHVAFLASIKNILSHSEIASEEKMVGKIFSIGKSLQSQNLNQRLRQKKFYIHSENVSSHIFKNIKEFIPQVIIFNANKIADFKSWMAEYKKSKILVPVIVIIESFSEDGSTDSLEVEACFHSPLDYDYFENYLKILCDEDVLKISQKILRHNMISKIHELETVYQNLKKLDQRKSDFITIASHELQTPLTIIKSALSFLQEMKHTSPPFQKLFEAMERNVTKMVNIVRTYLMINNIESFNMKLSKKEFSISELTHDVITAYDPIIAENNMAILLDIPDLLPLAEVDGERFKDILGHLLENAIKFSSKGKEIKISAKYEKDDLHIIVEDFGKGISKEDINTIFEKYAQLEDPLFRQAQGSGLGLYIVKRLVELHGGHIFVKSTPHKGSRFHIIFPQAKVKQKEISQAA
ncbi:MAG: hybrid sensor histidine kinase/response regulator [Deltaproteobacteria bacterium]|nr:hybrid sensor histidine kinase/response regulator [Deltaproteobacteria bacterium]